jgi:general secretion pathway protein G
MKIIIKNGNRQAGFNVIALIVIIINIGVFVGIIIPGLIVHPDEAKQAKATMQMGDIESALKLYKLDNGSYPTTKQGLKALVEPPTMGTLSKNWQEDSYLEKGMVPKDPWGNYFVYTSPGAHGDFDLTCLGADGKPGGEGVNKDINNWVRE